MAKDVKCTKPDCDCAEKEEQRIGGPIKYGYPCLADHPDLMKEKTRSALNKELTVQEQAEKFARCRIGDMGSLMDGFFAGHSLANDRIKELEEKLSSLKASMDILKELVECKNLNADSQSYMKTDHYYAYLRRFETAWEQARKVITGESIISNGEQKENENYVPYQLCPKCNGIGMVTPRYDSTSCFEQCDVCNGTKIIPMHPIPPQGEEIKKPQ